MPSQYPHSVENRRKDLENGLQGSRRVSPSLPADEKHPLMDKRVGEDDGKTKKLKYVIVIHGGAGTMSRRGSTPETQEMYKEVLRKTLRKGYSVLASGGEAMDATVAAVSVLEDCPLFNAGKGAVFNADGKNELETSLMLSKPPSSHPSIPPSRRGVGITLLSRTRNPSHLARKLYLSPSVAPHTMFSGAPAEALSDVPLVDPSYFFTERRWREHRRGLGLPEEPFPPGQAPSGDDEDSTPFEQLAKGTVGAVALDAQGCLACLTSTGGLVNKVPGRVGDTPQMGSGFWAEEWSVRGFWRKVFKRNGKLQGVGISGTGDGDYFIRNAAASTIARRMKLLGEPLEKAAAHVIQDLKKEGGAGGVIAIDLDGNVVTPLNTDGMYRGVIGPDGVPKVAIFADEEME